MKILKTFCLILIILGILFINLNSNISTNAYSQMPGMSPIPTAPGGVTASSCSLMGCAGYDATLGCTHCPSGNACNDQGDCQLQFQCIGGYCIFPMPSPTANPCVNPCTQGCPGYDPCSCSGIGCAPSPTPDLCIFSPCTPGCPGSNTCACNPAFCLPSPSPISQGCAGPNPSYACGPGTLCDTTTDPNGICVPMQIPSPSPSPCTYCGDPTFQVGSSRCCGSSDLCTCMQDPVDPTLCNAPPAPCVAGEVCISTGGMDFCSLPSPPPDPCIGMACACGCVAGVCNPCAPSPPPMPPAPGFEPPGIIPPGGYPMP